MTVSPDEAQAAAAQQVEGIAATAGGQDSAGIYGDPAGAGQHAEPQSPAQVASDLVNAGGQPAAPNVDELMALVQGYAEQLKAVQEQINAQAEAQATAEDKPPSLLEALASSSVGSQVAHLVGIIEERLAALEGK